MCPEAGSKDEPLGFMALVVTDQAGKIKGI